MARQKADLALAPSKPTHASTKLPEKYRQLFKFFNSLDSAIRLLKLKRSMSTLTNISPKIECLTDRRFSYSDLAQLKFLLPEAIEIKKQEYEYEKVFHARLMDFLKDHPEAWLHANG
ncbi:hypothetical protein Q3G72_030704 [Acer saccharum]|nr:hypothetical protein Q3G72_030704 [Acer saccharum]